jgi:hypothetical protein
LTAGSNASQLRVARHDGTRWQEVPGGTLAFSACFFDGFGARIVGGIGGPWVWIAQRLAPDAAAAPAAPHRHRVADARDPAACGRRPLAAAP